DDQSLIRRFAIRNERALLSHGGLAEREERLPFRTKTLREFRGGREIVRSRAGPQIEHDCIYFLRAEGLHISIERLEVRTAQSAEPQISDVALEDFAIERRGRLRWLRSRIGKQHDPAAQSREE